VHNRAAVAASAAASGYNNYISLRERENERATKGERAFSLIFNPLPEDMNIIAQFIAGCNNEKKRRRG